MDKKWLISAVVGGVLVLVAVNPQLWRLEVPAQAVSQATVLPVNVPVVVAGGVSVDAPRVIPFQAYLTGPDGRPVSGFQTLTFRLFDVPDGGVPLSLWIESHPNIPITNGLANLTVGGRVPFPNDLAFDQRLYLEVQVDNGPPLLPRHEIVPAIFATNADHAEQATLAEFSHSTKVLIDGVHIQEIRSLVQGGENFVVINDGDWHLILGTQKSPRLPAGKALLMYSIGSVWIASTYGELEFRPFVDPIDRSLMPIFRTFLHGPAGGAQGDQTLGTTAVIDIPLEGEYTIGLEVRTPKDRPCCTNFLRSVQWTILAFPIAPN